MWYLSGCHLYFEPGSLTGTWSSLTSPGLQASEPQAATFLCLPSPQFQAHATMPCFLSESWGSSLGPPVCTSALPSKASPQLPCWFVFKYYVKAMRENRRKMNTLDGFFVPKNTIHKISIINGYFIPPRKNRYCIPL